ncbi:MAG: hypothetical protein KC501_23050 [Myxococcales bacterium]|nr:hypothetical protein [Myxococcales bacterium]
MTELEVAMSSCEWRTRLESGAHDRIPLPASDATDGWAAPGVNFAGPGWRGQFRTRPSSYFDLAAKIHDLCFVLNDLEIEFSLGTRPQPSLSQKAKADAIFRIMADFGRRLEPGADPAAFIYRNIASSFFDGDDTSVFRANDGFRNPLVEPETRAYLNDPQRSLTIPYTAIARDGRPTRQVRVSTGRGGHRNVQREDYLTQVPMDDNPGFLEWFQQAYAPIYGQLVGIRSDTGESSC